MYRYLFVAFNVQLFVKKYLKIQLKKMNKTLEIL